MEANITCFKQSGKYYTEGCGEIRDDYLYTKSTRRSVFFEKVPGLSGLGEEFFIMVEPIDKNGVPFLILPESNNG